MERKRNPAAKSAKKVTLAKGVKVSRGKESKLQKKPGGSNVGKYKTVKKSEFCGSSGGAPSTSFPVDSAKRCRSALAYAKKAPKPEGIRACVYRKCKNMFKKKAKG